MSYCRFSSDDFSSDLYCYQSTDGYVTHVASNRVQGEIPQVNASLALSGDSGDFKKFIAQCRTQQAWLATAGHASIGGPYDGASFYDDTLEEFRDRLVMLRNAGYRFPNSVLEAVEGEIEDAKT